MDQLKGPLAGYSIDTWCIREQIRCRDYIQHCQPWDSKTFEEAVQQLCARLLLCRRSIRIRFRKNLGSPLAHKWLTHGKYITGCPSVHKSHDTVCKHQVLLREGLRDEWDKLMLIVAHELTHAKLHEIKHGRRRSLPIVWEEGVCDCVALLLNCGGSHLPLSKAAVASFSKYDSYLADRECQMQLLRTVGDDRELLETAYFVAPWHLFHLLMDSEEAVFSSVQAVVDYIFDYGAPV